jgi:hypothetical protein
MDYIIIALITIILVTFLIKYFKNKNKKDNKNNKDNKDNNMTYNFMKRPAEGGGGNVEKPAIVSEDEKPYIDSLKEWNNLGAPIVLKDFVTWTNSESGTVLVYKDMNLQNYKVMYFKKDKETGKYKLYFDKEYTRLVVLCDFVTGGMLEGFVSIKFYV